MLPLTIANKFTPEIQVCSGTVKSSNASDSRCISINFDNSNPQWKQTVSMPVGRLMTDCVLLPDGTILYTNGIQRGQAGGVAGKADGGNGITSPELSAHIFDPKTKQYSQVASSTVPRLYHSGAVLLVDGRVLTMGSEMQNYVDVKANRRDCMPFVEISCTQPFENRMEAFEPPYLSLPNTRPVISKVVSNLTYKSVFKVNVSTEASEIDSVSFIRYSTTTHSTNTDQRFVELVILGKESNAIYVEAPDNGNIAPPGNWMLFLLSKGKPSVAATILLGEGEVVKVEVPVEAKKAA